MNADALRRAFLDFFVERGHTEVPSAPLIPHDPTVLFTVAGMVPFKPYFVGDETAPYARATSVQKCVRAGGKHNDLDEIGRTTRHLSFFEMLGNFSFGDYFKADAIPWAWELVTDVLGLDPDRLWVTVHTTDDEAAELWRDGVGVPAERIQRLDEDNFWRMADTGPCGPSSEIFWDKGDEFGPGGGPAHGDENRFVEVWNLVFMQFDAQADGSQPPLPEPSIDTGAGLERLLTVLQGVDSVFDIDLFAPMLDTAQSRTGVRLGVDERSDVSLRILAEHGRTMTMLISDGVIPSNEDRGYVLRRIIRRAIRHSHLLGLEAPEEPITAALAATAIDVMGPAYPQLRDGRDLIVSTVSREEERFRQTLRTGVTILDDALAGLAPGKRLPGPTAFKLHDTYGFPLELTTEIAAERSLDVDLEGFDAAMAEQRTRAKEARRLPTDDDDRLSTYRALADEHAPTEFVGRDEVTSTATVLAILAGTDDTVEVVLDRTPFYAESGGQVGDTGTIASDTGTVEVTDTNLAVPGLHRHLGRLRDGEVHEGQVVTAAIDADRRAAIKRNHTGTHILHWALREVLGDHVKQQGSLVGPDYLRFDFSHPRAVTGEELARIEDLANGEILANEPVRHYETDRGTAEARGAIAFFGEKYGDVVRVLEAGSHSIELCGGTHVGALGDIGPIRITSESSIGSNVRRIVATTGDRSLEAQRHDREVLSEASAALGVAPDELVDALRRRLDAEVELRDQLKALKARAATVVADELLESAVDGVVVARRDGADHDELRTLALAVRDKGAQAVVLGGVPDLDNGKVALIAAVRPGTAPSASELLADAARAVGGGTGKNPELAQAGGRDASRLDEALDLARTAAGIGVATG